MNTYQRNILIGLGALTAVGIAAAILGASSSSSTGSGDGAGSGNGDGGEPPPPGKAPVQVYVSFNPDNYWTGSRKEQAADILLFVWQDMGSPNLMEDTDAYLEVMNNAANIIFPENLTAARPFLWPQTLAEQTRLIGTVGGKKRLGQIAWKGMRDILLVVAKSDIPVT